jgi:hypothetical protein
MMIQEVGPIKIAPRKLRFQPMSETICYPEVIAAIVDKFQQSFFLCTVKTHGIEIGPVLMLSSI